ncbi:unnamed protein product, partial [Amoebophrya sp. A25]|eukprot:GSA25T00019667001.1
MLSGASQQKDLRHVRKGPEAKQLDLERDVPAYMLDTIPIRAFAVRRRIFPMLARAKALAEEFETQRRKQLEQQDREDHEHRADAQLSPLDEQQDFANKTSLYQLIQSVRRSGNNNLSSSSNNTSKTGQDGGINGAAGNTAATGNGAGGKSSKTGDRPSTSG